jgi:hypothetical protein
MSHKITNSQNMGKKLELVEIAQQTHSFDCGAFFL